MTFNPCIVIPVYNHGAQLEAFLPAVLKYGIPVLLVDDGSGRETRLILDELANEPGVHIERRELNGGKGAAMISGFNRAAKMDFSHALQIDADGQHNPGDIPKFLDASAKNPHTLIIGRAVYDHTVPVIRLYGRKITHACVRLECLSSKVRDTMCGFRVYPLQQTIQLVRRHSIGRRMDFDIDIAVRLYWLGLPVINIDTLVQYHPEGVSHFRPFRDNARITLMHIRLIIGMIIRSPLLIIRHFKPSSEAHWSEKEERGSFLGLRFMLWLYRHGGRGIARLLTFLITFYFFLTSRKGRKYSRLYLERLHAFDPSALGHRPDWRDTLKHFISFGLSIYERFDAWMGHIQRMQINWPDKQILIDHFANKTGGVIIGAHIGGLEILRGVISGLPQFKFNALVFHQHAPKINRLLRMANPGLELNLIHIEGFTPDVAILLRDLVDRGEFIAVLADRSPAGARTRVQYSSFLGYEAPFPEGPFLLASLLKCPIYLLFCLRGKSGTYDVNMEVFEADKLDLPRASRTEAMLETINRYARALERQCVKSPYEWYNFHDFWKVHEE